MIVLVCGGRYFTNYEFAKHKLDGLNLGDGDMIVNGGARGADRLAQRYASERGIKCRSFPAQWHVHGMSAGPIRNRKMFDESKPDLVMAFPGGKGTADMVDYAESKKCVVVNFNPMSLI